MIEKYLNLDIRLFGHERGETGESCQVQVERSPVGEQREAERVPFPEGFRDRLTALERRDYDDDEKALIAVGMEIGNLLLPPCARGFFIGSLAKLEGNQGLRLRLKCNTAALDAIPWEFAYAERGLDRADARLGKRGFLVSDTRVSVVRYELGSQLVAVRERKAQKLRVVTMFPEPEGDPGLDLAGERNNLNEAMTPFTAIEQVECRPPTTETLQDLLIDGADVFHFAGHGEFHVDASGHGTGRLILQNVDGKRNPYPADRLASRLASKGIRIAFLGACQSAKIDGTNAWAGIAPSLVQAGIPAVIGMQFKVYDVSAIAFSRTFYRVFARERTVDEAVAEARSTILDDDSTGRDFATPVLYLRSDEGERIAPTAPPQAPPGGVSSARTRLPEVPPGVGGSDFAVIFVRSTQLSDYKAIHDALHATKLQSLNRMRELLRAFPEGTTVRQLNSHRAELWGHLSTIQRVSSEARSDPEVMQPVIEQFSHAMQLLNDAVAARAPATLEDALLELETVTGRGDR